MTAAALLAHGRGEAAVAAVRVAGGSTSGSCCRKQCSPPAPRRTASCHSDTRGRRPVSMSAVAPQAPAAADAVPALIKISAPRILNFIRRVFVRIALDLRSQMRCSHVSRWSLWLEGVK